MIIIVILDWGATTKMKYPQFSFFKNFFALNAFNFLIGLKYHMLHDMIGYMVVNPIIII